MAIYSVLAPITQGNSAWAERYYPQHLKPFKSLKRTQSYHLGRSLLQHLVRNFYQLKGLPEIITSTHGKPVFSAYPEISFNISHSNATLGVIIGRRPHLGIDLEEIKTRKRFPELEARVFTETERHWLHRQDDYEAAFFLLWSGKEAYLKAEGSGLAGLDKLSLNPEQGKILGPLNKGELCLALLEKESYAIYTPQQEAIYHYHFNNGEFTLLTPKWQLKLKD